MCNLCWCLLLVQCRLQLYYIDNQNVFFWQKSLKVFTVSVMNEIADICVTIMKRVLIYNITFSRFMSDSVYFLAMSIYNRFKREELTNLRLNTKSTGIVSKSKTLQESYSPPVDLINLFYTLSLEQIMTDLSC